MLSCHSVPSLHLPTMGLGLCTMTRSQHFMGSCWPNPPGKHNLHHRKMNHMLSQVSSFPCHLISWLFPHFDRHLLSAFIWEGIQEINFLRSCMSESFLSLRLCLLDTVSMFYVQNNFPSELWGNHLVLQLDIIPIPNPLYATGLSSLEAFGIYDNVLCLGSLLLIVRGTQGAF